LLGDAIAARMIDGTAAAGDVVGGRDLFHDVAERS
jgi:hypothetical protein